MKIKLLFFINCILATYNPLRLYTQSLEAIENNIDKVNANIIQEIYPNFFKDNLSPIDTGFYDIFYFEIPSEEINLKELNLKRIPEFIARKMTNVKSLDLRYNFSLEIEDEWFRYFYDSLEELNLNKANLINENFRVIQNCKSLRKLSISSCANIDIKYLLPIIPRLKYLDVSNCNLNKKDFKLILKHGINLEYLNFDQNNLHGLSNLSASNIKVLKVSKCELQSSQFMDILLNFTNLEEVDFSKNIFNDMDSVFNLPHDRLDLESEPIAKRMCCRNSNPKFNLCDINLKKLNLNACGIKCEEFVKSVFDIKGLETLKIGANKLNFDFKEIVRGKARDTLKILDIQNCSINSTDSIKCLTDFPVLEQLNLSYNTISIIKDDFSLGISKNSLKELDMSNCDLNQAVLHAITDCSNLENLNLSVNYFNDITDDFSLGVSKYSLKEVDISSSYLGHNGLKAFTECEKIEIFDVSNNLFGNIPTNFSFNNLKNTLKDLNISQCNLNINGFNTVLECERIEILNISLNDLSDIPDNFIMKFKESLKELEINICGLTVKHLKTFTDCPNLLAIHGYENDFSTGENEFKLGCSKDSLKDLNLEYCSLDKSCLKEITDCPNLKSLDLTFNRFDNVPVNFIFGRSTTALCLPMVAIDPRSLYSYSFCGLPKEIALRFFARFLAWLIATFATCGWPCG